MSALQTLITDVRNGTKSDQSQAAGLQSLVTGLWRKGTNFRKAVSSPRSGTGLWGTALIPGFTIPVSKPVQKTKGQELIAGSDPFELPTPHPNTRAYALPVWTETTVRNGSIMVLAEQLGLGDGRGDPAKRTVHCRRCGLPHGTPIGSMAARPLSHPMAIWYPGC